MSTGDNNNMKLLPLLYLVGVGILCTAAINKWRAVKKSELRHQEHRRLLEEPSKAVD
ncbi:hypothetical protein M8C21_007115 [Ambrosia artemisiifolia]|uniref:Uncharacterized protein n=1 Tax=Ambrosia artemisiifolia TaxID=4212 RepID=A0AAD5CVP8_AMBAR|nr:hypothetical protein M8C21_007115 [Ambrosia artemisiifolia]